MQHFVLQLIFILILFFFFFLDCLVNVISYPILDAQALKQLPSSPHPLTHSNIEAIDKEYAEFCHPCR